MADKLFHDRRFIYIYTPLLFLIACLANVLEMEIYGAAFLLLLTAATLVLSSRLTDAMLPALLMAVFITKMYNPLGNPTYRTQLFQVAWVVLPVVAAVVYHFIRYRKPFAVGRSFYGLCAISVALILGGLGTISAKEYFSGAALFYTLGLGVGMVAFYLLIKPQLTREAGEQLVKNLYLTGLMAGFCVVMFYVRDLAGDRMFLQTGEFIFFQSSNNLATFLMLAMPFPVYMTTKNPLHILSLIFMYVCVIFTGSRGGLVMGSIELVILLGAYVFLYPRNLRHRVVAIVSTVLILGITAASLPFLAKLSGLSGDEGEVIYTLGELIEKVKAFLMDKGEARYKLLERMVIDFKSNPVFGVGIGYTGNENVYKPVAGAMNWYHMWFAQVIGGLGILGILTYGYQLVDRVLLFIKSYNRLTLTLFLSYLGLFLMSQVNPGEFCPAPYAMLAVTFFVVMEQASRDKVADKAADKIADETTDGSTAPSPSSSAEAAPTAGEDESSATL